MRFCQAHWERLKAAIADRGMDGLVARSGEEAVERLKQEVNEGGSLETFDPLMAAHNMILGNAMKVMGPENSLILMTQDDCPLCVLNDDHKRQCKEEGCTFSYDNWCEKAADDVLAAWRAGPPDVSAPESPCPRPGRRSQ